MATTNTPNTVPGLFKNIYASLENLVPDFALIQKEVEFSEAEATGDQYIVGVKLQHEHGFSYGPSSGSSTLLTLNAAIAGYVGQAKVEGYQMVGRARIDYAAASKAAAKGRQAFENAYGAVIENLVESARKRLELTFLYGQQGLGKVSVNSSGTLTLTDVTWAPGIWSGMKDAVLEAFDAQSASATQDNGDLTITSVVMASKQVVVSGTSTNVDNNSFLYLKGTRTNTAFNESAGVDKILSNSGTLFNINAATYELWQGQSQNVNGPISRDQILAGIAKAHAMGLMEDVVVWISPKRWNELNADEAASRVYDESYKPSKAENGAKSICYFSTNGQIEVKSHPMIKEGEAFALPMARVRRIGSSDLVFKLNGTEELVLHVADASAYEMRIFSDQAMFITHPARCVRYYGITDPA